MTAASPVTIYSSPPALPLRGLSVTPPSAQQHAQKSVKSSSSPKLPSPSTFVPRCPTILKTGSRAQPAPEGAKLGFVSAGSLWRDGSTTIGDNGTNELLNLVDLPTVSDKKSSRAVAAEGSGTLKKPTKTVCANTSSNLEVAVKDVALQQNAYDIPVETTAISQATAISNPISEAAQKKTKKSRATKQTDGARPPGRPRKKVEQSVTSDNSSHADDKKTKPSKRKAKSADIIFNPDDPELDVAARQEAETKHVLHLEEATTTNKPVTKPKSTARPRKKLVKGTEKQQNGIRAAVSEIDDPHPGERGAHPDTPRQSAYFSKSPKNPVEFLPVENVTASSVYFAKPAMTSAIPVEAATSTSDQPEQASFAEFGIVHTTAAAVRRRRSWTPVRDTETVPLQVSRPTTAGSMVSESDSEPKPSLAGIIGNFSYQTTDMAPPPIPTARTPSSEATTKRRRIELVDTPGADSLPRIDPKITDTKPVRAKAPKKKPQTITAVATAAFLPPQPLETPAHIASAYFAPGSAAAQTAAVNVTSNSLMLPPATKAKKQRKSRSKIAEGVKDTGKKGAASKTKKVVRVAKQAKTAKSKDIEHRPKLYSPENAVAHLQNQCFLFGTSSQLAPAESTQFIKDMQAALHESERDYSHPEILSSPPSVSQRIPSPQKKSSIKVPTAPHGTSLSIEQGTRELWSVCSRDFGGGLFALEKADLNKQQLSHDDIRLFAEMTASMQPMSSVAVSAPATESKVIEVNTSPITEAVTYALPISKPEEAVGSKEERRACSEEENDDSRMVLSSDDNAAMPTRQRQQPLLPPLSAGRTSPGGSPPPFLRPNKAMTSPYRPALHPLDSNLKFRTENPSQKLFAAVQASAFTNTAPDCMRDSTVSQSGARSTSNVSSENAIPKKRGRPPKTATNVVAPLPKVAKLKESQSAISRSQPASYSEWLHIDEISDSEAPNTPSPPRRRAQSPPPEMPRLTLGPSKLDVDAPDLSAPPPRHSLKPDGPQWPEVRTALFPRITERLKSQHGRTDTSELSWWEKILLYDPIVVEDLTEWLNNKGLHVQIKKKKVAVKSKKRKAGADECDSTLEPEMEMCNEPLQPWMVQKWCEENSICCYLKKGSWRGGRTAKN